MVNSTSDGRSSDGQDAVANAAKSLSSLSDEQIVQLVAVLLKTRKQATGDTHTVQIEQAPPPVQAQDATQQAAVASESTVNQRRGIRFWKWLTAVGAGALGILVAVKSLASEKEFWKSGLANTIPLALAIPLSILIVPWAFDRDRAAAEPRISIEYAVVSYDSQLLSQKAVEMIGETSRQPIYRLFVMSRVMSGSTANIGSFNMQGARLSAELRRRLLAENTAFHEYLIELRRQVAAQKAELDKLDDTALQQFAFRTLDDPSTLDASAPRTSLSQTFEEKTSRIDYLLAKGANLGAELSALPNDIRVRLTLLNRGATDGLVRHEGELTYRGVRYAINRVAPPSAVLESTAIPVFQTNQVVNEYSARSVGKIDRDSMSEFWYVFRPKTGSAHGTEQLCLSDEVIEVTLYDHNKNPVQSTLECNEGES